MLELVALRMLCAVAQPHIYSETVVIATCAGRKFTAKGKTVKHPGWKALEDGQDQFCPKLIPFSRVILC